MSTATRTGWALLGLTLLLGLAATARAADDDSKLKEKALSLNRITGEEPENDKLQELIKDAAGTKKLLAVASAMAKDKKQPFNANATLILAKAAHAVKENDAAEQFYRLNIEQSTKLNSSRKLVEGYFGLISLLYNNRKYAEAEKLCREFLELEPDETLQKLRPLVDRQMILAVAKQNQADKAIKMIDTRIKDNPKNWILVRFKAQLQHELGQNDEAIKTYEGLIEKFQKDEDLTKDEQQNFVEQVQYALTGIYVDKKQVDKATDLLQKLLDKHPDDPTYNNDLGFILADHDMKLPESEKMIRKALEEDRKKRKADPDLKPEDDKDNAAYLDSLGWVLFKLKKYKEAKPFLVDALKDEEGQHVEIYDHLAEVQMALGEKKEAAETWKKGVEAAGPTKREQERKAEIEKKLKELMK